MFFSLESAIIEVRRMNSGLDKDEYTITKKWYGWVIAEINELS